MITVVCGALGVVKVTANGLHLEAHLYEPLVVQDLAAIEDESWPLHLVINAGVVIVFELVPLGANHKSMGFVRSLVWTFFDYDVLDADQLGFRLHLCLALEESQPSRPVPIPMSGEAVFSGSTTMHPIADMAIGGTLAIYYAPLVMAGNDRLVRI